MDFVRCFPFDERCLAILICLRLMVRNWGLGVIGMLKFSFYPHLFSSNSRSFSSMPRPVSSKSRLFLSKSQLSFSAPHPFHSEQHHTKTSYCCHIFLMGYNRKKGFMGRA